MVERVFVHIGAPKTGTTYLQQALGLNREPMKDAGVLYPPGAADAHHVAAWDLREMWEQRDNSPSGPWRLAAHRRQGAGWDGPTALLSSELFVYADEAQAATALGSFGDAEVHVIYTARDLVRQVPAVWQERLKNQRTMPYEKFVADVIGPSTSAAWRRASGAAQDTPRR